MSSTEKTSLEHNHSQAGGSQADDSGGVQEPRIRTLNSDDLFEGAKELGIEHQGLFYRLKITRQGKLVLNK
ncbi:MAG: hemin uptake protein HemP [Rhizobiaceae bacterium]|nr:hemin uptake protein HemP [Rhizobiaceae bacterium]